MQYFLIEHIIQIRLNMFFVTLITIDILHFLYRLVVKLHSSSPPSERQYMRNGWVLPMTSDLGSYLWVSHYCLLDISAFYSHPLATFAAPATPAFSVQLALTLSSKGVGDSTGYKFPVGGEHRRGGGGGLVDISMYHL